MSESTELKQSIDKLRKTQENLVSLKWNFFRGVLYGFGFFVGGTMLVALLIYVLSFFNTAPVIGQYISHVLNVANLKVN